MKELRNYTDVVAYAMAQEYDNTSKRKDAIEKVKDVFADVDLKVLEAMWYAIDAYVDTKVAKLTDDVWRTEAYYEDAATELSDKIKANEQLQKERDELLQKVQQLEKEVSRWGADRQTYVRKVEELKAQLATWESMHGVDSINKLEKGE